MPGISRRELLAWFAIAPTLPRFLVDSAHVVSAQGVPGADAPIVVVLRMLGGNDGLNTVVPFRDDRYYKLRPTIAIASRDAISMAGGDAGLNPWLSDVRRLMDEGHAAIVQGVGYAKSSRSHSRSAEIFETASVAEPAPPHGWLGRYLDHACSCGSEPVAGIQFGDALGRTLASNSARSMSIAHPRLLLDMDANAPAPAVARGPRANRMDYLRQVENNLGAASRELRRATKGHSSSYDYPDTNFGQSLRWTADMIETGSPTRVYYATIGSFESATSPSFDTHSQQLEMHRILYTELGRGLRSFVSQLKAAGQLDRVLLLTFSDFGRQVAENRDGGTDHGDASVVFAVGGKVRPGLLGEVADLGRVHDGGLQPNLDFRQIYANVLGDWLKVDPAAILGERIDRFHLVA